MNSSGAGILGHNMYLYCANNPINLYDPTGRDAAAALLYMKNNPMPPIPYGPYINGSSGNYKYDNWLAGYNKALKAPTKSSSKKTKINSNSVLSSSNNGHGNAPKTGKPNSKVTKPNGDVRVYGPDGKALKDIDKSHPQRHPELQNPHEHDWEWDGNNSSRGKPHNFRNAGIGVGIGVGAYLLYRGVRMLPSLAPPLWWTIPANAAIP